MADTIFLKHQFSSNIPLRVQHFYDGRANVRFGVIELPKSKPAWIDKCFILGFRVDPDSGRVLELSEIRAMAREAASSTESAGEVDEGSDNRGQPAGKDGLRKGKLSRDDGVSPEGVESRSGDGTPDPEDSST